MSAAILYHPDGYSTKRDDVMGRHVAGESFLTGLLRYGTADTVWIKSDIHEHREHFLDFAKQIGCEKPVEFIGTNIARLAEPGTVFCPGPGIGEYAQQRSFFGHDKWNLCGINHTTSSATAMDSICNLAQAPVFPWDSVICTSRAVQANIKRMIELQTDYLVERMGGKAPPLPMLPIIPLGIDSGKFAPSQGKRAAARAALDIDDDTIMVLFAGRLSFHAKAHPLAMYLALEKAAQRTGKKFLLVESGRFASEFIGKAFEQAAKAACPSVTVRHLDGRSQENFMHAWMGADIFCTLSDCIQEAFGITPLEAMASGLPVIVSDWDGYKDTVEHREQGFRIPTVQPPAGVGGDLAFSHASGMDNYDRYIGYVGAFVSIDIEAAAEAFVALGNSPELRKKMGAAGLKRIQEIFEWKVIIPQYEALWAEQDALRAAQAPQTPGIARRWPARSDPFDIFAAYPSEILSEAHFAKLIGPDARAQFELAMSLDMVTFAERALPNREECLHILDRLANGPVQISEILPHYGPQRRSLVFRAFVWLAKIGVISLSVTSTFQ